MKKYLLMSVLFLFVVATRAWAQERSIAGRVVSAEEGAALPGVSVTVKGSTSGTTTDANGNYQIRVAPDVTLVFSFIGFTPLEVQVGNRTSLDVRLQSDVKSLSEVVVVGYGTQLKQDLTGNVASLKGQEIQNIPVPSVDQAIQGRAAGVFVESQNGKLGQGIKIRVRGASSVSASNQPLYVVDNIPITSGDLSNNGAATNPLADLNFNDVESIEVLKDASAAAIYGSRASNGVVLITTKKGKSGKTNFNLNYFTGWNEATNRREFLNAQQYVDMFRQAAIRGGRYDYRINKEAYDAEDISEQDVIDDYSATVENRLRRYSAGNNDYQNASVNTDWQDQVFRRGAVNQFDLNANGGTDKTRFYVSGQYSKQNGLLIANSFERISGLVNLDHKVNDRLSFGLKFNMARTLNKRVSDDNEFSTPVQIVALSPITPVIDPRTGLLSGSLPGAASNYPVYYNPLLSVQNAYYNTTVFRNLSNVYASYEIIPGLTFRSEFGVDLLTQNEEAYYGKLTFRNTGTNNGSGYNAYTQVFNYTTNNFLRYNKVFGEVHDVDFTVGMSYQDSKENLTSVNGQQFPSDAYKQITSAAVISSGSSTLANFSFLSYFARANYKFSDRYLLGLSGRIDGSSRFGQNNRYGFFPALSAGWIISEEQFLKDNSLLSFLKLRASYGLTGNAEIGNFPSRGLFTAYSYAGTAGARPTQLPNPDLKWETTAQTDIGLDFGFFNNRISGEVDYYVKETRDLLLNVNVPATTGFSTQTRNVGKLENKGWEVVLNTQNLTGAFQWTTSINYAANRNKITDLNGQVIQGEALNRAVEGQPIGVFYGREFAGADPANGDAIYYLNTVNPDGSINRGTTNNYNAAQQVVLGNPNPKWIGGITNTFSYKGLELSVLVQGVFGNKIYNGGGAFMSANASNGYDNQTVDQLNYWKQPGDITNVPEVRLFWAEGVNNSSRYLSDGSYVRFKTVTLGYTFPQVLTSRIKLTKLRLYASAQNLFTITKYKGWDPEVNSDTFASNITQGYDFYSAPQAKTITFGINVGF